MTTTALTAQIGVDALELTVAGVDVPGAKCGPVTIRRGRDNPDSRPDPATLTVAIKADALPALPAIGDPITVELGADAIDRWWPAGEVDVDVEDARRRFTGTIAGPSTLERDVLQLVAAGNAAPLGRRLIGDEPWPAESDGARAARILALAGAAGIDLWDYTGATPDGWFDQWLGAPGCASLTADVGALKITWHAGAVTPGGFAWRYTTPQVAGKTYTIAAEVYVPPGNDAVQLDNLFVSHGDYVKAADRWQTISHTYTAPDSLDRAIGISLAFPSAARVAGHYCLVRAFRVYESDAPIVGRLDPGTVAVLGRDVDRRNALELLEALAVDSSGELVELRDGRLEWHDADHRRAADPAVELTAGQVLRSQRWTQDPGGIVNDLTVVYGEADVDGNRPEVRVVDQLSVDDPSIGRQEAKIDTQLADQVDAEQLARIIVGRHSRPTWRLSGLAVELTRTVDAATARQLLALEFGDLLAVTGQPAASPLTAGRLWLEGSTELISRNGWQLQLEVSDYGASGPPVTWAEVDPSISWAEVDPSISWLGATSWRPPTTSAGRWLDQPAGMRWSDLDPVPTWTTYETP